MGSLSFVCQVFRPVFPKTDLVRLMVALRAAVQHGPAASIGPPYVYSYRVDDKENMYAAVRAARDNPIER